MNHLDVIDLVDKTLWTSMWFFVNCLLKHLQIQDSILIKSSWKCGNKVHNFSELIQMAFILHISSWILKFLISVTDLSRRWMFFFIWRGALLTRRMWRANVTYGSAACERDVRSDCVWIIQPGIMNVPPPNAALVMFITALMTWL